MRIVSASQLARFPSHHAAVAHLGAKGFRVLGTGGSGAAVLCRPRRAAVYKLGDDPALRCFADLLRSRPALAALPQILAITEPGLAWTGMIVERLRPMDAAEEAAWRSWITDDYLATKGNPLQDPLGLAAALAAARAHLLPVAATLNIQLDIQKPDNVMVRASSGQLVLNDPFY
jgi:hypothetical protein